jgi:hypothetical protein
MLYQTIWTTYSVNLDSYLSHRFNEFTIPPSIDVMNEAYWRLIQTRFSLSSRSTVGIVVVIKPNEWWPADIGSITPGSVLEIAHIGSKYRTPWIGFISTIVSIRFDDVFWLTTVDTIP